MSAQAITQAAHKAYQAEAVMPTQAGFRQWLSIQQAKGLYWGASNV